MLIRRESNGVLWIDGPDPATEARLDREAIRLAPGELQWIERVEPMPREVDQAAGWFSDRGAILFGKGPSLDRWLAARPSPAEGLPPLWIACNEAANVLPSSADAIFVMDGQVFDRLKPDGLSSLVVSPIALARSRDWPGPRYFWRWTTIGRRCATAASALATLALWGVRRVRMVGFDGYDEAPAGASPGQRGPVYARALLDAGVPERGSADFSSLNREIDWVTEKYGLELEWWHRGADYSSSPASVT